MNKKGMRKLTKSFLCFLLAALLAFQGTEPIFVQAKEAIENAPREIDFSRPEALESPEEAGVEDTSKWEQTTKVAENETEEVPDNASEAAAYSEERKESQPEEIADEAPGETSKEVELKKPTDYYPLPEEPEGELVDYDEESKTYITGEKQYTTVIGGHVGTYKDDEGKVQLVDNSLEVSDAALMTAQSDDAEESGIQEVYQNKANDYAVFLPKNITDEAGMVIAKDDIYIELVPIGGDYSHSVVKDNAIL